MAMVRGNGRPVSASRHCTMGMATTNMTATLSNVRTQPAAVSVALSSPTGLRSVKGTLQ